MAPTAVLTSNLFMSWWPKSQSQFQNNVSCPFVIRQSGELFGGFSVVVQGHDATWVPATLHIQHRERRGSTNIFHTHMVGQNLGVCLVKRQLQVMCIVVCIVDTRRVKLRRQWPNSFEIKDTRTSSCFINENENASAVGIPSSLSLLQCDGWW